MLFTSRSLQLTKSNNSEQEKVDFGFGTELVQIGPTTTDWIEGYTSIALMAKVFMFPISFSSLIMVQILWNGQLHRCPDLFV